MKKIISLIMALLMLTLCFAFTACDTSDTTQASKPDSSTKPTEKPTEVPHVAPKLEDIDFSTIETLEGVNESATETDYVKITVRNYGDMIIRLYPDVAPATVANFKKLVSEKFYDGLIFHRVIRNFMIQGGDPTGTGMGGANATIKGEFTSNGFTNNLLHKKGVVSMARSSAPNSASSQFFICHKTKTHLDGNYASFGYVIYGLDVVDAIASVSTDNNDRPREEVVIESIRFVTIPNN